MDISVWSIGKIGLIIEKRILVSDSCVGNSDVVNMYLGVQIRRDILFRTAVSFFLQSVVTCN
jgi:hypothetical protein